ncbi:MAG: phytanoyl-CoA dioxygenase family protein [Rhodospirillales bacterium]|nr:phytanoyl-CoA dioxygenase family protein [Rhodospirillales bacterium]
MLRTPVLPQDQIDVFYNTGSLIVRGAFSPEEAKLIQKWTDELAALPEAPGRQWVFHEKSLKDPGQKLVSRIEYIHPFHAGFKELAEALRAPVGQLLGEEAVLFKEKVNFKMPGGDGFKPHQDSQAGWDKYADFFISVLVCIDEATVENGCLEVVSGHHKRGLFRSWEPMTADDMNGMEFVPVPTKPGDLIFFDCYAPHQSKPNLSGNIRRLYYATYNKLSAGDHQAQYYADKRKSYPPDIEREPGKEYVFRV